MEKIIRAFREYFSNEVEIPDVLLEKGSIEDGNKGWYIRYVICKNENKEKYLDFIAHHRMTNTRHHRITSDGEISFLEMYHEAFSYNSDIPGDREKKEQEYLEHNREISRILIKKGLMEMKGNEALFK